MNAHKQVVRLGLSRFKTAAATKVQGEGDKRYLKFPVFPKASNDDTASTWVVVLGDENIKAAQNAIEKGGEMVMSLGFKSTFFDKEDGEKVNKIDVNVFKISSLTTESDIGIQTKGGWTLHNDGFNFAGDVKIEGEGDKIRASAPLMSWMDPKYPIKNHSAVFVTVFGQKSVDKMVELSKMKKPNDKGVGILISGSVSYVTSNDKVYTNIVAEEIDLFKPESEAKIEPETKEKDLDPEPSVPTM